MKKQESNNEKVDIFGMAIKEYYIQKEKTNIIVHSPEFDDDVIPVDYLFRNYEEMPVLERTALDACSGRILDVGCGAGSHALYLQESRNLEVTGIDISPGAVEVAKLRGLNDVRITDFFDLKDEKFDTLLFLMNGTGIIGKLDNLDDFFIHSRSLLNEGGKILIDSSDLRYLFDEDEDGGFWIDADAPYYGEMEFSLSYKNNMSPPFNWLYLSFSILEMAGAKNGFSCKMLKEGEHYDYLALLLPQMKEE